MSVENKRMNWHEAVDEMYKGNVVKYIGTENGQVWTDKGGSFCMCRGVIFVYRNDIPSPPKGAMVYDPDFRYELTGKTVDTRSWPLKESK